MNLNRAWSLIVVFIVVVAMANVQAAPATVSDVTVDLPSGKVFYRDSGGKGPPLVLLHASSSDSRMWENQIPAFANAGYRVIAINYRGVSNGASPVAVIQELTNKIHLDKFHLLGTAGGGAVAFQYALSHPDRLRSLTVSNSIADVEDRDYVELVKRLRPPFLFNLPIEFRELGPCYRATNPDGVRHWLSLMHLETPELPIVAAMPSFNAGTVTWSRLESLKIPVLLITGDADLYLPPPVLRMFADHIKQAEVAVISESGHSAYWENPDIFNRTVMAFISKH